MNLDRLIEKYEKDSWFKFKTKINHFSKKAKKVAIAGAFVFGAYTTFNAINEIKDSPRIEKKSHNPLLPVGLFLTYAASMLGIDKLKKKKGNPIVTNPNLSSGVIWGCSGLYIANTIDQYADISLINLTGISTMYSYVISALSNRYLSSLSDYKWPHLINSIKAHKTIKEDKNIEALSYIVDNKRLFTNLTYKIAVESEKEDCLEVTDILEQIMNKKPNRISSYFFENCWIPLITSLLTTVPIESLTQRMLITRWHYTNGNYVKAMKILEKENSKNMPITQAFFFNLIVKKAYQDPFKVDLEGIMKLKEEFGSLKKEVSKKWEEILTPLLKKKETEELFGKRIKVFNFSEFIKETLVIKQGNTEELNHEILIAEQIENAIQGHDTYRIAQPLTLIEQEKESNLISLFSKGRDLFNSDCLEIQEVSKFLRLIHNNVKSGYGKRNYRLNVEKRIKNSKHDFLHNILDKPEWDELWHNVGKEYVIDMDPHGGQWVVSEFPKRIYRLDFADKGEIQPSFQLTKLAIESNLMGIAPNFVVEEYYGNEYSSKNLEEYFSASIISALSYFCIPTFKGLDVEKQSIIYLVSAYNSTEYMESKELSGYVSQCLSTFKQTPESKNKFEKINNKRNRVKLALFMSDPYAYLDK